jgi:hypothetical protein
VSRRAAFRLAWSLCAFVLLLQVLSALLIFLGWTTPLPQGWIPWRDQTVTLLGAPVGVILAGLIASRRPENPYGWLWLCFGFGVTLVGFAQCYAAYALVVAPGSLPVPRAVGTVVAGVGFVVLITLLPLLLLLFPTGYPPSRLWRFLVWLVLIMGLVLLIGAPFVPGKSGFAPIPNPLGVKGGAGEAISIIRPLVPLLFLANVPAFLSLVIRYRRASGVERQQIKWFAYACALLVSLIMLDSLGIDLPEIWNSVLTTVSGTAINVAVGIAILRYRLYEIDILINRTLVYGSLTAMLIALYFGAVVLLQSVFVAFTGEQSTFAVVASTLLIAALFNPLRRRIQSLIDRSFYRRKYDAAKTLEAFSLKLRDKTDLEALNDELVGVVRETMQPAHVSLWLPPDTTIKGQQAE